MKEEFDFESIKNKALEQLKSGKSLLGKNGAFAPLLESILNAALEEPIDKDFSVVGKTHKVNINEIYEKPTGETTEEEPEEEREEETEPEIVVGDSEFFTGITLDQFTGAVKVLKNMEAAEEEEKEEAAKVLYQVQNTDMFEFVATQVSNVATLDKLFNTYFDGNGLPKPRPRKENLIIDGFDINAFI